MEGGGGGYRQTRLQQAFARKLWVTKAVDIIGVQVCVCMYVCHCTIPLDRMTLDHLTSP